MNNRLFEEFIGGTTDWFQCLCGNQPNYEGFYSCLSTGEIVSPTLNGEWDGNTYLCEKCSRVIDGETLKVVGVCSEQIAHKNDNYDWNNY
jgi:hypothetical protein